MHPLLKVKDFSPYVAKIKASGADTVITGNWGNDLALLLKAAAEAGLQVDWYTYYAGGTGGPTAVKQASLDHRVFADQRGHGQVEPCAGPQDSRRRFRAKSTSALFYPRAVNEMRMFAAADEQGEFQRPGRRSRPSSKA